jgi:dipeptidyl aminopeptidase/acylaminoacyl peptidase
MNKPPILLILIFFMFLGGILLFLNLPRQSNKDFPLFQENAVNEGGEIIMENPLSIEYMRRQEYPGSDIVIEQNLEPGTNYQRFIASYKSEGLKIYGLLTFPNGETPNDGWPAIVFNHGYIPPNEYRTTERYVAYVDNFARNGYVVFKIDYRGHGNSEGEAVGAYGSLAYTIDALNAFFSLQKFEKVDPDRIGMWGHSMGGMVTLRSMVINPNIKAGVIWAGVVGSYPELLNNWRRSSSFRPTPSMGRRSSWRTIFQEMYGAPGENQIFWNSISPTSYVNNLSGPIQLHHATGDESVPYEFSQSLHERIQEAGKLSELFIYEEDDHNISKNFSLAAELSLQFFNIHVKG